MNKMVRELNLTERKKLQCHHPLGALIKAPHLGAGAMVCKCGHRMRINGHGR